MCAEVSRQHLCVLQGDVSLDRAWPIANQDMRSDRLPRIDGLETYTIMFNDL